MGQLRHPRSAGRAPLGTSQYRKLRRRSQQGRARWPICGFHRYKCEPNIASGSGAVPQSNQPKRPYEQFPRRRICIAAWTGLRHCRRLFDCRVPARLVGRTDPAAAGNTQRKWSLCNWPVCGWNRHPRGRGGCLASGNYHKMPIMGGRVKDESLFGQSITEYFSGPPQVALTPEEYLAENAPQFWPSIRSGITMMACRPVIRLGPRIG